MGSAFQALPPLQSDYPLTPGQIDQFRRDGHVLLRGVCTPGEVAAYRPVLGEAVDRFKAKAKPLAERDTYGKAFLQIETIWVSDGRARGYVMARRFARIAAQLMGVRGVRLYHDQALFKEGGGGHTPRHQDEHYWPLLTDNTVRMWMPLVDVTPYTGVMGFALRSHTRGCPGNLPISDTSESVFRELVHSEGFPLAPGQAMAAGDATFRGGWTLHNAPANTAA